MGHVNEYTAPPDGGNKRACKFGVPAYELGRDVQMTPESASLKMLTLSAVSWSDEMLSDVLELPVLLPELELFRGNVDDCVVWFGEFDDGC